jgi:hypothetical protein
MTIILMGGACAKAYGWSPKRGYGLCHVALPIGLKLSECWLQCLGPGVDRGSQPGLDRPS